VRYAAAAVSFWRRVGGVFRLLMRRVVIGASRSFEYHLRNDFLARLQQLDAAYFQRNRTGDSDVAGRPAT
jgi:hypothetical protein